MLIASSESSPSSSKVLSGVTVPGGQRPADLTAAITVLVTMEFRSLMSLRMRLVSALAGHESPRTLVSPSAEGQNRIQPAERERIGQRRRHVRFSGMIRNDIEVALGVWSGV